MGIAERHVLRHTIPMTRVGIRGFEDPEKGDQQVVVALWKGLPTTGSSRRRVMPRPGSSGPPLTSRGSPEESAR